jgi:hypothetical protein
VRLNAPRMITFLVAFVVAVVAVVVGKFVTVDVLTENALWIGLLAYAILAVANMFKGL